MLAHGAVAADEAKRPNILFAFVDDWGRHASAYARLDGPGTLNDAVRTPNFDRVAREGVLFRRAFVSAPSCTPCRSALLSGQHFWRTGRGAILQGAVWDPQIPSFPLLLRDAGYHIGQTSKVWAPGTPNDAPFGGTQYEYEQGGRRYNDFSEHVTKLLADGESLESARRAVFDEVRATFDAFLADRKPGQPFCYWFGPTNVHRAWVQGSGKALWGIDPDSLRGKLPRFLPDVPEVREDVADYFGEIQAFDAMLGLLLTRLEELGELETTLIAVSGDHGAPGFPHGKCNLYDFGTSVPLAIRWGGAKRGRVVQDLVSLPDLAPTFLEAGGVKRPENMTGRSLLDVLRSEKSGQVDPQRTAVFIGRERHVAAARDGSLPYPQRAIRTHDHLYIINFEPDRWPLGNPYDIDKFAPTGDDFAKNTFLTLSDMDHGPTKAWLIAHRNDSEWQPYYNIAFGKRPREELYVVGDDPDQVKNVAGLPKYAQVQKELKERLLTELQRTGDPRITGDGLAFERPPLAGPVSQERKP
ncbi:MAG: sulfatase family protein [Planctomycetaceae bacterium]